MITDSKCYRLSDCNRIDRDRFSADPTHNPHSYCPDLPQSRCHCYSLSVDISVDMVLDVWTEAGVSMGRKCRSMYWRCDIHLEPTSFRHRKYFSHIFSYTLAKD